jgi:hypothetical protein
MFRVGLAASVLLTIVAGCGSASTTIPKDGAVDSTDGGEVACADQFAASHAPNDPCAVDSDCHDPFLVCTPMNVGLCRSDDTPPTDTRCTSQLPRGVPLCPEMAEVTLHLCAVRYQQPCDVATDCGPSNFACTNGHCQQTAENLCTTAADCPQSWECTAPCPCPPRVDDKRCYPPFAELGCPACFVPDTDASAPGD